MTDTRDVWLLVKVPDVPNDVPDLNVAAYAFDVLDRSLNVGSDSAEDVTVTVAEHIGQWLTEHEHLPADQRFISNTDLAAGPVGAEFAPYMVNVYREVRA